MENWKKAVRDYIDIFTKINSAVCIASAVYITLLWKGSIDSGGVLLWQIIIVSALCAVCSFFYQNDNLSKKGEIIRTLGTYVYIHIVVLTGGFLFEWFLITDWKMVVAMEVTIIVVYAFIKVIYFNTSRRSAKEMNALLEKREEELKK